MFPSVIVLSHKQALAFARQHLPNLAWQLTSRLRQLLPVSHEGDFVWAGFECVWAKKTAGAPNTWLGQFIWKQVAQAVTCRTERE